MTIAELIKELEKMPQNAKVKLGVHVKEALTTFYANAEYVEINKYNTTIYTLKDIVSYGNKFRESNSRVKRG